MTTRTLVDSNILIYSITEDDKEKKIKAKEIITELLQKNELTISIQNLAEITRVCREKIKNKINDENLIQYFQELRQGSQIIKYDENTIINAIKTSTRYNIHFFDALLVTTMLENDIRTIVTENTKDFEKISNLKIINPFK